MEASQTIRFKEGVRPSIDMCWSHKIHGETLLTQTMYRADQIPARISIWLAEWGTEARATHGKDLRQLTHESLMGKIYVKRPTSHTWEIFPF